MTLNRILHQNINLVSNIDFFSDFLELNLYKNFKYSKNRRIRKKQIKKHTTENIKFNYIIINIIFINKIVKTFKKELCTK